MALELARRQDGIPLISSAGQRAALSPETNDRIHYLPIRQIQRWDGAAWVAESPAVDGDAIFDKAGAVYNVKHPAFGAKGDGTTDDTAAIQAAIDAAISSNEGGTVLLPLGDYKTTSTLNFISVRGLRFVGAGLGGTALRWYGNSSTPMLDLQDCRDCEFASFSIRSSPGDGLLDKGIRIQTIAASLVVPTMNLFKQIEIDGTSAGGLNRAVSIEAGTGGNANNDFHRFEGCFFANYDTYGVYIGHTMSVGHILVGCYIAAFSGNGTHSIYCDGGGFNLFGGIIGTNGTADIHLVNAEHEIVIIGVNSEGSPRFLTTAGPSSFPRQVLVQGCRWAGVALHADKQMIQFKQPGPLVLLNNRFGEGSANQTIIYFNPLTGAGVGFVCKGNVFAAQDAYQVSPFDFTNISTDRAPALDIGGNVYCDGAGGTDSMDPTFGDGDTTPNVTADLSFWRTNNSSPTTITDFDGGHMGQRLVIRADDPNTTIADNANIRLKGGTSKALSQDETIELITLSATAAVWDEI